MQPSIRESDAEMEANAVAFLRGCHELPPELAINRLVAFSDSMPVFQERAASLHPVDRRFGYSRYRLGLFLCLRSLQKHFTGDAKPAQQCWEEAQERHNLDELEKLFTGDTADIWLGTDREYVTLCMNCPPDEPVQEGDAPMKRHAFFATDGQPESLLQKAKALAPHMGS